MMQAGGKGIALRPEHRKGAGKETDSAHPGIKEDGRDRRGRRLHPRRPRAGGHRRPARPPQGAPRPVTYRTNNHMHMRYDKALASGWPIATGVIEGACRFVIEDRFGITGARWSPDGAEDILKIRAIVVNGDGADFEDVL